MSEYTRTHDAPRKRRKIALACERCRSRKIRCDGGKPSCGPCQHRTNSRDQSLCTYLGDNTLRSREEQDYVNSLQERVRHLESRSETQASPPVTYPAMGHQQSSWMNSRHDSYVSPPPAVTTSRVGEDALQDAIQSLPATFTLAEQDAVARERPAVLQPNSELSLQKSQQSPTSQESPVNGMGTIMTATTQAGASHDGFYGNSSAISFFHQVQKVLDNKVSSSPNPRVPSVVAIPRQQNPPRLIMRTPQNNTFASTLESYSLPPRSVADELLQHYWRRAHSLHPIIHKATFLHRYRQLWEAEDEKDSETCTPNVGLGSSWCPDSVFHCALNAMLALGSNFSDLPTSQRIHYSETFSQRSLELLQSHLLDNGNLAFVQTLLIAAQYLQSTDLPHRCWNVVGLALRVAQGLGLYIEIPNGKMSSLEKEIRQRTWHGCLMFDVITGMTLGRPSIPTGASNLPLPNAIDDEYLECGTRQPAGVISEVDFYVQTLKLYSLMGDVLTQVYRPWQDVGNDTRENQEKLRNSPINTVIDLECALSDFEANIPLQLRWDRSGKVVHEPSFLERHRNVLQTRFVHLKLLLHRPIFHLLHGQSRLGASQSNSSSSSLNGFKPPKGSAESVLLPLAKRCAMTCVESAQDLIALIDRMIHSNANGAWWYNLFYLFTAAMALILGDVCLKTESTYSAPDIEKSWKQCLDILEDMSQNHIAAGKCAKTLVSMRDQVLSSSKNSPRPQQRPDHSVGEVGDVSNLAAQQSTTNPIYASETILSNTDEISEREAQLQDILWMNSNVPLPWNSQEQDWWDTFAQDVLTAGVALVFCF